MDYTITDGEFYKVMYDGEILSTGKIEEGNILSTIHEVIFIAEEEYLALVIRNIE